MSRYLPIPIACLLAMLLMLGAAANGHAQSDQEEAINNGAKSLRGEGLPWYDSSKDDIRRVDKPSPPWLPELPNWRMNGLGVGPIFGQLIQIVFVAILLGLLSWIIYLMVKAYLGSETSEHSSEEVQVITDEARIEQLPFQVRQPNADLLQQAREHYEKAEFNEAIVYLYSYMLVHLDKNRLIRLSKGKTNRQYLRELGAKSDLSGLLERTMVSFEEAFFGCHTLHRDEFESSWRQLDHFHQNVTEASS